ncbi:MAG TPA: radical SAM/SPASM domain-containing protein [Paludibacter sp.]|nr:radical SAM/SPASM domain-containing protein [Paludibacter sp.]
MKFKKIYIEITNSCNFDCSFCFKSSRALKFMSVVEFQLIINKIRPYTDYIYLHVLGEPLLHPQLDEMLTLANAANLYVNITTNGALIERKKEILMRHSVRQINISLHDAEENIALQNIDRYFETIFNYADEAASKTYINLRLWNSGEDKSLEFNKICIDKIANKFNLSVEDLKMYDTNNGIKLADHVFLQHAPRFDWPDGETSRNQENKNCYALRDHIAILCDGTVVPCCLDADGNINLGNIFTEDFQEIILSDRALKIRTGFQNNKITEEFCKSCGFIIQ